MTAIVLSAVVFGLGFAIGHMFGIDAGVRQTEALSMLRMAFERPLIRRRRS